MQQISVRDRIRYEFDNMMAKGPVALIGWLALLSAVSIVTIALIVQLFGLDPEGRGFLQLAWGGLMRTMDSGTVAGDTGSWPFLFAMLTLTLIGIFVVSSLIGILITGLEGKMESLRKGRSFVAEVGHSIILGWSPQIFTLISELVLANANQRRAVIVVLADKDAVEMGDEIQARVGGTGRTRIVLRTGVPHNLVDLRLVNPDAARSIVILAPEDEDADAYVIKTILALTNRPDRSAKPYHIVGFLRDNRNLDVARMVGRDEVELIGASELIARITAQTCRQSGLSIAYTELLDFGGDEIYFKQEPGLTGKSFQEALTAYEDSALIGLRFADGRIQLNPPMSTRLESGDKVIAISADDDTIQMAAPGKLSIDPSAIRQAISRPAVPERTLVLGWNERAALLVDQLDHYVGPGSSATIVAFPHAEVEQFAADRADDQAHRHLVCAFTPGDITDRGLLDTLGLQTYDHIIVLSEATETALDPQQIDARTLITLLHLRDISDKGGYRFSIVSEMLDIRNRELAQVTRADDFVVSDKLISLMLSQISENKELAPVFQDLFDPEGSEIYFKPAEDYIQLGKPVTFYTVVEAARQRNEVAIGYRLQAQANAPEVAYGVKLNPSKSQPVTFSEADRIIVLADS